MQRSGSLCLRLALALGLCAHGTTARAQYTFTQIADLSSGVFNSGLQGSGPPALNNAGTAGFRGYLAAGGSGLFTGNGGILTTIVTSPSESAFAGFQSLSEDGTMAFIGNSGATLFTGNGGPLTPLYSVGNGSVVSALGTPVISPNGMVAFRGALTTQPGPGIFKGNGGPITTIADKSGGVFIGFNELPAINAAGAVAFHADLSGGGQGIYRGDGGAVTPIADTSGPIAFFDIYADISATGEVVFQAQLDAGGVAIMTGNGGALTTQVTTSGPFSSLGDPAINAAGEIAFSAGLDAGGVGIYTGADPAANKVIASGDTLFGHTVNSISFFRGLNDSGQIAFYANFSDGTQGIFRADPTVPAPDALLTVLLGAVPGAVLFLRRRRKS